MKQFNKITARDIYTNPGAVFDAISNEISKRQLDIVQNGSGERNHKYEDLTAAMNDLPVIGYRKKSRDNMVSAANSLEKTG